MDSKYIFGNDFCDLYRKGSGVGCFWFRNPKEMDDNPAMFIAEVSAEEI
jgi:hypothetical protein